MNVRPLSSSSHVKPMRSQVGSPVRSAPEPVQVAEVAHAERRHHLLALVAELAGAFALGLRSRRP
jgi:hypothetical protein